MDRQEYFNIQFSLHVLAQVVVGMDLAGFLQWIERSETMGPILAPTLYVQAGGKMNEIKRLAEACQVFQDEARRQMGRGNGRDSG